MLPSDVHRDRDTPFVIAKAKNINPVAALLRKHEDTLTNVTLS